MFVTTVLSLAMLGQADLLRQQDDLDQAVEKSRVIVVAELESCNLIFGSGACAFLRRSTQNLGLLDGRPEGQGQGKERTIHHDFGARIRDDSSPTSFAS